MSWLLSAARRALRPLATILQCFRRDEKGGLIL
jgi:hypothetical protein